jgi:hypothetical protein
MKLNYLFIFTAITIISCNFSKTEQAEEGKKDLDTTSTIEQSVEIENVSATNINSSISENVAENLKEVGENVLQGEKEKDTKLSKVTFCDCIKQQQQIDLKIDDAEEDDEIKALMDEMDKLNQGPCKEMLHDKQTSPDQREERKRKIEECLSN